MAGKRKNYSADFKAKVALEAIRGEATIAELVAKQGVHQTVIHSWKRQALEGMAAIFSGRAEAKATEKEGEIEQLYAKIGQSEPRRVCRRLQLLSRMEHPEQGDEQVSPRSA